MFENNKDLAISSQAPKELGEGSTTRLRSPERTVKAQECATTKKCKYCKLEKSLNDFYVNQTNVRCKACWKLKKQEERAAYPERGRATAALHRARMKEFDLEAYNAKEAFRAANRRAYKMQATPSWANLDAINEIYMKASSIGYHVDHIVPLKHPLVCGLHVETNLQILPPLENLKKSNVFLVDDIVCSTLKEVEE